MPIDMNSFGVGGEGLSGLFMGQDRANAQAAQQLEQQKILADIANTQEITRQRQLGNQQTEALMPDVIANERSKMSAAQATSKFEAQQRGAQAMSRLGSLMDTLPAAARPAALRQMAGQFGVDENDPLLGHLMTVDPTQLPKTLNDYSKHLFEQSDASRAQAQKAADTMAITDKELASREKIAAGNNATTLAAANIAANARLGAANARGGRAGGSIMDGVLAGKISPDKAITYYEMKEAQEGGLSDEDARARDNLKRYMIGKTTAARPDTAGQLGLAPDVESRITNVLKRQPPAEQGGQGPSGSVQKEYNATQMKGLVEKSGGSYEPNKYEYRMGPNGQVQRRARQVVPQ